jgi:hypothetical protein
MSDEESPLSKQDLIAIAIAKGTPVSQWARENQVALRTAYRWASEPDVRRQVEDWRRRALDKVLARLIRKSLPAVTRLSELSESASSESVQLTASRAILRDQIAIARHANLSHRVAQLEEQERARLGSENSRT